jgi:hypothetical protein
LIAEEVDEIDKILACYDDGVTPSNINWNAITTYMLKEMKILKEKNEALEARVALLEQR